MQLENVELSDTSLLFSHFYQFLHKCINKKIAQKIADGFLNWDRDRDRDLHFSDQGHALQMTRYMCMIRDSALKSRNLGENQNSECLLIVMVRFGTMSPDMRVLRGPNPGQISLGGPKIYLHTVSPSLNKIGSFMHCNLEKCS